MPSATTWAYKLKMRLYQRANGVWYVEFERGHARSLKTKDRAQARTLFNRVKREYLARRITPLSPGAGQPLGEYAEEFLEWAEGVQPPATYRANRLALDKLIHVAGPSCRLDKISHKHLDAIVSDHKRQGVSIHSINTYIRHIKAVLGKAVEWERIKSSPVRGYKQLRTESRPPAILSPAECTAFLASVEDVDARRIITAYLSTGRRRAELVALDWSDVDMDNGRYLIRKSKAHLSKYYPIGRIFRAVLDSMKIRTGPVFSRWRHPDTISHVVKAALNGAGYGHLRLHDLRHTFASNLLMAGETIETLQDLLGHTDSKTTQIYRHFVETHLQQAVDKVLLGPVDLAGGLQSKRRQ